MKHKIKHIRKKSVFKQYIITYILFFWIVIGLFVGVLYSNVKNNMQEKWEVEQANKLLTMQYIIDFNFEQINLVAREIERMDNIRKLELEEEMVKVMEFQEELRNIKQFMPMVEEIIIYLKSNKYIYSDLTTYTAETLKSVRGIQLDQNTVQEDKVKLESIDTLSEGKKENNLLISYPILGSRQKEVGTINLIVNSKEVKKIINQVESLSDKRFLILVGNELVWNLRGIQQQELFYIQSLVANKIKGEADITLEEQDYKVFFNTSPYTKLKYIYCVNNKDKASGMLYINEIFISMSLLCIVLSGGMIYLLTCYNYKPLKSIKSMINQIETNDMQDSNEFKMIEQTISQLTYKNAKLGSTLGEMRDAQTRYLFYKLLKGSHHEKVEEIKIQLETINLAEYRVIIYALRGELDIDTQKRRLSQYITEQLGEKIIHIELGLELRHVVCIFNNEKVKEEETEKFHEELQKIYVDNKEGMSIVIGKVYYNWEDISKAFKEVKKILDYRTLWDANQTMWQEKLVVNKTVIQVPNRLLAKLKLNIDKANISGIRADLEGIGEFMSEQDMTYKTAQSMCHRIISEVVECLDKEVKTRLDEADSLPITSEIKEIDSIDQIKFMLSTLCEVICKAIEASGKQSLGSSGEKADLYMHTIRYLKQNYMNSDLSIQEIADNNHIALPNLTMYFKKQVGQTPKDYLTHIRMKHAKELLVTTKESLGNIANQSGYQNVSSFIRQFKKIEGITPGEYRKLNTKS
ncbi:MAG: helix-turn-helix domain-containing protein [Niameybacter sp.]